MTSEMDLTQHIKHTCMQTGATKHSILFHMNLKANLKRKNSKITKSCMKMVRPKVTESLLKPVIEVQVLVSN